MTLEQIKDKLANEHYSCPFWNWLPIEKQAMLVDHVATEYALEQINGHLKEIDEPCVK